MIACQRVRCTPQILIHLFFPPRATFAVSAREVSSTWPTSFSNTSSPSTSAALTTRTKKTTTTAASGASGTPSGATAPSWDTSSARTSGSGTATTTTAGETGPSPVAPMSTAIGGRLPTQGRGHRSSNPNWSTSSLKSSRSRHLLKRNGFEEK